MLHTNYCHANSVWAIRYSLPNTFTRGTGLQGRAETSARPRQANNLAPLQTYTLYTYSAYEKAGETFRGGVPKSQCFDLIAY